jgi:hypothetical protein
MPRVKPHHHPCAICGAKTECPGTWRENWDGFPEVVCDEWHMKDGTTNSDFLCEGCESSGRTLLDEFQRDLEENR